jgi:hypothetical protein
VVVGVLVRGLVCHRLARREMEHGILGFSVSVIRWFILTFPHYQYNVSGIRELGKIGEVEEDDSIAMESSSYLYILTNRAKTI